MDDHTQNFKKFPIYKFWLLVTRIMCKINKELMKDYKKITHILVPQNSCHWNFVISSHAKMWIANPWNIGIKHLIFQDSSKVAHICFKFQFKVYHLRTLNDVAYIKYQLTCQLRKKNKILNLRVKLEVALNCGSMFKSISIANHKILLVKFKMSRNLMD